MEKNKFPQINVHGGTVNNYNIDIHDNTFHGGTFNLTDLDKMKSGSSAEEQAAATEGLAEELTHVFADPEAIPAFIAFAQSAAPREIPRYVSRLVKEGKIYRECCKRKLYNIMKKNGLYDFSESNWDKQIEIF